MLKKKEINLERLVSRLKWIDDMWNVPIVLEIWSRKEKKMTEKNKRPWLHRKRDT